MIRCPTCGSDLLYSPIPALYFCLERMVGERITINLKCKPWISKDASVEDLLRLTERIETMAPGLRTLDATKHRHAKAQSRPHSDSSNI